MVKIDGIEPGSIWVIVLFLFLALFLYAKIERGLRANAGWLQLNRGLASGDEEAIHQAQETLEGILEGASATRLSVLENAKLQPDNFLVNGGFEYYQQGWNIEGVENTLPTVTDEQAYKGERSLEILFPGTDVNFYQAFQEVKVVPSSCYLLSAFIQTENLTDGVGIEVWDAERGFEYWYGGRTQLVGGTSHWKPISFSFCTPEDVKRVQIRLRRYGGNGQAVSGTAWFDEIKLESLARK